jgi:hypothetical protein
LKNEEIYNVFNTEKLLRRPVGLAITDKSGMAGVALWVRHHIGEGEPPLSKDHPGVRKVHEWVMAQYEDGRATPISDREMADQTRTHLAEWLTENGYEI